jgi:SpoVK/Ycf46/Vps4 family AAA+-type ATPase
MNASMPVWAQQVKDTFRSGTVSQFIISGNIHDSVPFHEEKDVRFFPLKQFLTEVLFASQDIILFYNRGKGIQLAKGAEHFFKYMQIFDKFHGSRFASDSGSAADASTSLEAGSLLPRDPIRALELIDRFLQFVTLGTPEQDVLSLAVVIDYASFIVPRGESLYLSGEIGAHIIKILNWAQDPAILGANVVSALLSESLNDLSEYIVENPFNCKIAIPLPQTGEIAEWIHFLVGEQKEFEKFSEVDIDSLTLKLQGLNRIHIKNILLQAMKNNRVITMKQLARMKKEIIEKEAFDRLEFLEFERTLDDVAGHDEAKAWLREDAQLLKKGVLRALPMGYLITGRIGTGKTYLVECFAGECGVPFVALKNFREKWVGATEGNLEKVFHILHALGQVVVFIDEADQMTGKRDGGEGDSGLSGRVYGMLAKEMADTANRGKILWIFATSRPDLLEVDLKRQGRLDIHIPLLPPDDEAGMKALFMAMARKLKIDLKPDEIPSLPFKQPLSGNEIEGLLIRALRVFELQADLKKNKPFVDILTEVICGFRPSQQTRELELMDMLAVRECTDERFLPVRFKKISREEIDKKIALLSFSR